MKKTKIAILGSSSHIAKGLISNFFWSGEYFLHLYARSLYKIYDFLDSMEISTSKNYVVHEDYNDFMSLPYDIVINCVGVGTLNKSQSNYADYFTVNEEYDNLVIEYLRSKNPNALYICFSSGAVYGKNFAAPVVENSLNCIRVNRVAKEDYYSIVKLNSEAKHRAFNNLNIVDLRVFSYFSRFVDLADGYFVTEVIDCVLNKKELLTDSINIVRDYVHPQDLFTMVKKCMAIGEVNEAFDVVSAKPVEKREILDYFVAEYGLKYKIGRSSGHANPTGVKIAYCSQYNNAIDVGYKPVFSSMDVIQEEAKYIINQATNKIKRG